MPYKLKIYIWEVSPSRSLKSFQFFDFWREPPDCDRYFFLEFQDRFIRKKYRSFWKMKIKSVILAKNVKILFFRKKSDFQKFLNFSRFSLFFWKFRKIEKSEFFRKNQNFDIFGQNDTFDFHFSKCSRFFSSQRILEF